jgi:hypothetical protein
MKYTENVPRTDSGTNYFGPFLWLPSVSLDLGWSYLLLFGIFCFVCVVLCGTVILIHTNTHTHTHKIPRNKIANSNTKDRLKTPKDKRIRSLIINKKFWKELIAYFHLIRHWLHRKRLVQQLFYCCLCIHCHSTFLTSCCLATTGGYTYGHTDRW